MDNSDSTLRFCKKCQCDTGREPSGRCRQCRIKYRSENKDAMQKYQAQWNARNIEHVKAYKKADHAKNKEQCNIRSNEWKLKNPDRAKAYRYAYYAENAEHCRSKAKAWRAANPESVRQHWEKRRALKKKSHGSLSPKIRDKLFLLQCGKCPCCGQPLGDDYHLDHIMPLALGGANIDENVQLLTASCNHRKSAKHPVDFMQSRGFLL